MDEAIDGDGSETIDKDGKEKAGTIEVVQCRAAKQAVCN